MRKVVAGLYLLLLVLGAASAGADEKSELELPTRVATHHTLALGDRRLDYDAIAESLQLTDAKGATTATVYTISYLAETASGNERPVSFVFNGGPGAASVF